MSALPPPIISAQPEGLIGFLGLKNGGRNPRLLDDREVICTLDLWERYLWSASEIYQGQTLTHVASLGEGVNSLSPTTPVDLPNGVNVEVPQGEWWILLEWNVGWRMTLAGQIYDAVLGVQDLAIFVPLGGELGGFQVAPAGTTAALAAAGSRYWSGLRALRPGSLLQTRTYQNLGATGPAPITATARFRFTRLPV